MRDVVQVKNPRTHRWVKVDRAAGHILAYKKSPGPWKGVRRIGRPQTPIVRRPRPWRSEFVSWWTYRNQAGYHAKGVRVHGTIQVKIFRSTPALRAYLRWQTSGYVDIQKQENHPNTRAVMRCLMPPRAQIGRHRYVVGELCFAADCLGAGLIAHEITHAALHWGRLIGITGLDNIATCEEPITECVQLLTNALNDRWHDEQVYAKAAKLHPGRAAKLRRDP